MADVFVLCHTIAVFVARASGNFPLGKSEEFIFWPLIVAASVAAAGFVAGAILLRFVKRAEPSSITKHMSAPCGQTVFWALQIFALAVAVAFAVVILTLIFDYILLHFFAFSTCKKLILAGVGSEIAVLAVAALFRIKKLWAHKRVVFSAALPLIFAVWLGYYLLLTLFPSAAENVLFWGGSGMFVMLPVAAFVALVMRLGTRKRKENAALAQTPSATHKPPETHINTD